MKKSKTTSRPYPSSTWGSRAARKAREVSNRMGQAEREAALVYAMKRAYGNSNDRSQVPCT